jgi:hypothetical protein
VTDLAGNEGFATASMTVVYGGITIHPLKITPKEGYLFTGLVALFSGPEGTLPTDYNATIDWGDGDIDDGEVVPIGDDFGIEGEHTYDDEGEYDIIIGVTPVVEPPPPPPAPPPPPPPPTEIVITIIVIPNNGPPSSMPVQTRSHGG